MTGLEIFLIIIGFIIVACSYVFSEHLQGKQKVSVDTELNVEEVTGEMIRSQIEGTVEEIMDDIVEKTESILDRTSNEKIIAVSEYSDKVISEIQKTHSEVMFLYNMLNDKEMEIKDTLKEAGILKNSIKNIQEEAALPQTVVMLPESKEAGIILEEEKMLEGEKQFGGRDRILELHRQGNSIIQIAKELGAGIGEVKLVLDLFQAELKQGTTGEEP